MDCLDSCTLYPTSFSCVCERDYDRYRCAEGWGGADAYTVRGKCCNTPVRIVINTEIHGWKGGVGGGDVSVYPYCVQHVLFSLCLSLCSFCVIRDCIKCEFDFRRVLVLNLGLFGWVGSGSGISNCSGFYSRSGFDIFAKKSVHLVVDITNTFPL